MHVIADVALFLGAAVAFATALQAGRRREALVPVRIKRDRR